MKILDDLFDQVFDFFVMAFESGYMTIALILLALLGLWIVLRMI